MKFCHDLPSRCFNDLKSLGIKRFNTIMNITKIDCNSKSNYFGVRSTNASSEMKFHELQIKIENSE